MPRVPLVARKAHVYAGRRLQPGDRFEAQGTDDARVLKAIGVAVSPDDLPKADPPSLPPGAVVETEQTWIIHPNETRRNLDLPPVEGGEIPRPAQTDFPSLQTFVAGEVTASFSAGNDDPQPRRRRTYKRRDMTAEDE
jgi:hypothetical protein